VKTLKTNKNIYFLGPCETDNINQVTAISESSIHLKYSVDSHSGLGKSGSIDHVNQMMTLSVSPLSGFCYKR
jgi:hypothetical protein